MTKYIVISGGVYSGQGKGMACASLALLLKQHNLSVTCLKLDGYLNTNASCINPKEHGELFIGDDGIEADLDLGTYERIGGINISRKNICTSGTIYQELRDAQDHELMGKTIQVVPHFSQKVIDKIHDAAKDHDICLIELGGCVGDIECAGFYEAIRQFKQLHQQNCLVGMLAPILWINSIQEFKTKPLQRAVKDLQSNGLQPDFLFCRSEKQVPEQILEKVSNLTNVHRDAVFDLPDVDNVYKIPLEFYNRKVDSFFIDMFSLIRTPCKIHQYKELVEKPLKKHVHIGVVGKYENSEEAYVSIKHSLYHAGVANSVDVKIIWLYAEKLEQEDQNEWQKLKNCDGIIVPGGFDKRGVEGKISAIWYARENKMPFLGICLGLQCAVIDFAQNVLMLEDANSEEFAKCKNQVIHYVEGQKDVKQKSGTMRLGAYTCRLQKGSKSRELYGEKFITERHRHRLEVNGKYIKDFGEKGFKVTGRNPDNGLVEIMELEDHPYFIGCQFHPEFKSRIDNPAPLFNGLIKAACPVKTI